MNVLPPLEYKCTLLYIEDNLANTLLLETIFARYKNIRFLTAETAEEGLVVMRAEHPSAVLMDLNLPGMSGLEALSVILNDEDLHQIPVIAVTASILPQDISDGIKAGFFDYIGKPVRVSLLISALKRALDQNMPNNLLTNH